MKVIHPKTKSTLIMNEFCHFMAEIGVSEQHDFIKVTIGLVGHQNALVVYRDEWLAFNELVDEIDEEWNRL